jgi:predicted transcriptional regulator
MGHSRSNRIAAMGELQLQVLDHLIRCGEATAYDILERFPEAERPRYTTVLTVLRALEEKGLATHRKQQRAYVYRPTDGASRVRGQLLGEVLDRAFGSSPRDLLAALLDMEAVTPEVLEELRALLAEPEVRNDGPGDRDEPDGGDDDRGGSRGPGRGPAAPGGADAP